MGAVDIGEFHKSIALGFASFLIVDEPEIEDLANGIEDMDYLLLTQSCKAILVA